MIFNTDKWKFHKFDTGENRTCEDFKEFSKDFISDIRFMLKDCPELKIKTWAAGYFCISGFLGIEGTEKCVYFNTGDVRDGLWQMNILMRPAANERDYRGGTNRFVLFEDLGKTAEKIRKEIVARHGKDKC